jgi:hypothetical protein
VTQQDVIIYRDARAPDWRTPYLVEIDGSKIGELRPASLIVHTYEGDGRSIRVSSRSKTAEIGLNPNSETVIRVSSPGSSMWSWYRPPRIDLVDCSANSEDLDIPYYETLGRSRQRFVAYGIWVFGTLSFLLFAFLSLQAPFSEWINGLMMLGFVLVAVWLSCQLYRIMRNVSRVYESGKKFYGLQAVPQ